MLYDDPKGPSRVEQIGLAVAIAGLSTLVGGLIQWGIHELQVKYGSKPKEPTPAPAPDKVCGDNSKE